MKRRSPQTFFEFIFHPLGVVDGADYDGLSTMLESQVQIPSFKLRALRRRNTWAIELPPGAFSGDLSGDVSIADDLQQRDRIMHLIKARTGAFQLDRSRDLIQRDGVWYYRRKALEQFRIYIQPNFFFVAAYKLILAAEKDPSYVMGEKTTTAKPLAERPLVDGRRAPGPRWRERDDYVLRKWFGKWPDGKHRVLTDAQWSRVLDELRGFRSKESVKRRLSQLNAKLKKSLMVDGYIKHDAVKAYLDGFLGERAVVPRFRPRLHGDYYPTAKRRNPASSTTRSDGTSSRRPSAPRSVVDNEAKKRILKNPPVGFHPTTVISLLDMLAPLGEEATEPHPR